MHTCPDCGEEIPLLFHSCLPTEVAACYIYELRALNCANNQRIEELERIRTEQDEALSTQNARVSELLDENATIKDRLAAYEHRPTEPNFAVCDDPTIPYDRW